MGLCGKNNLLAGAQLYNSYLRFYFLIATEPNVLKARDPKLNYLMFPLGSVEEFSDENKPQKLHG
jgi:hypothetical protein